MLNEQFELFWNVALGRMIGMDEINGKDGTVQTIHLWRAYFKAFEAVRLKLKEQWILNA